MASHAIWTGAINFGLVSIPVKLFSAVRQKDLRFHFLHDKDRGRINNVRKCSECGKEVKWDDVIRGYEYERGQYVVLSAADWKRIDVEATQSVDIAEFVDLSEIDPMLFDTPYYLEPEKKGRHAYALLRDVLAQTGKVGIARVVLRSREHLAALRASGPALTLEMMHFADEIVKPTELDFPPLREKASPAEAKAAMMLVRTMSASFDPSEFHDKYRKEVLAMIEARAKGEAPAPAPKKARARANVIDLVSVLERSLHATKKHRESSSRAHPKRAAHKHRAA